MACPLRLLECVTWKDLAGNQGGRAPMPQYKSGFYGLTWLVGQRTQNSGESEPLSLSGLELGEPQFRSIRPEKHH